MDIGSDAPVKLDDGADQETDAEKGRRIEEETGAAKKAKSQKKKVSESQVDCEIPTIAKLSSHILSPTSIRISN